MVTSHSNATEMRVWMRPLGKPLTPTQMLAEGEKDLEWMEEEGNTCGHEINCKNLDQGPQFTPLYPLLNLPQKRDPLRGLEK